MGTCWNCNTEITLKDERVKCDNCDELIRYWCNSCKEPFDIADKKTKKQLHECPACGYFQCPHCNTCSYKCPKINWEIEVYKILHNEKIENINEKIKQIVDLLVEKKISIDRRNCPERNVPISYAKGNIKGLLARFEGFRVKDIEDREAFLKRFDEISEIPLDNCVTVSGVREKGSYGQEYRDAFNLAVCMGKFKIEKRINEKSGNEYELFIRCELGECPKLDVQNLIINECKKCKTKYPRGQKLCNKCPQKTKGKNKGDYWELKERLNDKDTCQVYRGDFIKK